MVVARERAAPGDGDSHGLEVAKGRPPDIEDWRQLTLDEGKVLDERRENRAPPVRGRLSIAPAAVMLGRATRRSIGPS